METNILKIKQRHERTLAKFEQSAEAENYCPRCGGWYATDQRADESGTRRECPFCGMISRKRIIER